MINSNCYLHFIRDIAGVWQHYAYSPIDEGLASTYDLGKSFDHLINMLCVKKPDELEK